MIYYILLFLVALVILIYNYRQGKHSLKGKHVVITGGSSGIGKELAILAVKQGAHVTILARNVDKLVEAQKEIQTFALSDKQEISQLSVNVSDLKAVKNSLDEIDSKVPIYMLVTCAGMAICAETENYDPQQIKNLIDVNLLGTLYPIQIVTPKFKKRKEGFFVLVGSQASLMGVYGMSVYSACKFAVRGLAESLYMEVKHYNLSVTLALPPDTDTPGFENENKSKPEETKLISQSAGLLKPDTVAEKILDDALNKKFFSCVGFESFLVTTLCVGMTPFNSFMEVIVQTVLLGPIRFISSFYIISFHKIIKDCYLKKESKM